MAHHSHAHGGCCDHDHGHNHHDILNRDNLDEPAEANIDLDAMHPEIQLPESEKWPLTEEELRDDFVLLTEDGGIKKKIITQSSCESLGSPPTNSKVTCHYTGTLPQQNDEKFDSSRDRNEPFVFKIGAGQVIKGWDIGIASMKKGERCILRCAAPYAYGENGSPPKIPGGATLDFDVSLISWDSWADCEGAEGEISKNVVVAADDFSDTVGDDAICKMNYRIYWMRGGDEEILSSQKEAEIIVNDDDRYCDAFHLAIKSMKCGEKSVFKVVDNKLLNTEDVYIEEEKTTQLCAPNNEFTFYEINCLSLEKAEEKWNATNERRIEVGNEYKNAGNNLFKMQRYFGAIKKYQHALDWIDIDFSDENLAKQKSELIISTNNNLSLLFIKKKDWSSAIAHANAVLQKDANNLKALMRRGQARLNDGALDLSKRDLKRAAALDKNNSYCKKLLKICTIKHKEYVQKQQKLYAGMFGAAKSDKKVGKIGKKREKKKEKKQKRKSVENEKESGGTEKNPTLEVDHRRATEV